MKTAYSVMRRLVAAGRFRPWLDCTVAGVFQAAASELRQIPRLPRIYTSRFAARDDAAELGRFFGAAGRIEQRLERGDICIAVFARERVCAGAWLALGPALVEEDWDELRCLWRIPAGAAWGYDGRGAAVGAWGTLMMSLPGYLAELGADRIAVSIHYNNHLSIDSHASLGFRPVGWFGCLRLLGLTFRTCRPVDGGWRRLPSQLGSVELL